MKDTMKTTSGAPEMVLAEDVTTEVNDAYARGLRDGETKGFAKGFIGGLEAAANTVADMPDILRSRGIIYDVRMNLAQILRDQAAKLKGELK